MALFSIEELDLKYISGELLALAKHEGIPIVKVTIRPPMPKSIIPINHYTYDFWLDDKFTLGQYFNNKDNRWHTNTRSMCKENKQLTDMMQKYFPKGIVDKDTVKKLPILSIKNFSKNDHFGKPFEIGVTEGTHIGVFDSEGDCIYEGNSKEDCIDYCNKNVLHFKFKSELLNFSERIRRCFSNIDEYYTQTYEVSVPADLSRHPDWNPKSHPADECLPDSLKTDLESIGVKCKKSGFMDVNNKDNGYTILEFDIERKPRDRYEEITDFIKSKLVEAGFDKDKIGITKWD